MELKKAQIKSVLLAFINTGNLNLIQLSKPEN